MNPWILGALAYVVGRWTMKRSITKKVRQGRVRIDGGEIVKVKKNSRRRKTRRQMIKEFARYGVSPREFRRMERRFPRSITAYANKGRR